MLSSQRLWPSSCSICVAFIVWCPAVVDVQPVSVIPRAPPGPWPPRLSARPRQPRRLPPLHRRPSEERTTPRNVRARNAATAPPPTPSPGPVGGAHDPPDRQGLERGDRVRLRPQPHAAGLAARVPVVEIPNVVEPGLHAVAPRHQAEGVPPAERRRLHFRRGDLPAPAVVVVEPEVVLESIGAHHVIPALVEPEHDAAGGVLSPAQR